MNDWSGANLEFKASEVGSRKGEKWILQSRKYRPSQERNLNGARVFNILICYSSQLSIPISVQELKQIHLQQLPRKTASQLLAVANHHSNDTASCATNT